MSKHTPGPWTILLSYGFPTIMAGDKRIADAYVSGAIQSLKQAEIKAEIAANFTLIAAAPDLLEAAKHFTDCQFDSQGRAVVRVDPSAMDLLRNAIAKAEGR